MLMPASFWVTLQLELLDLSVLPSAVQTFETGSKKAAADDAAGTAAGTLVRAAFFFAGSSFAAASTSEVTAFGTSGA